MRLILVLEHQETVLTVHQTLVITIKVSFIKYWATCQNITFKFLGHLLLKVAVAKKIIIW